MRRVGGEVEGRGGDLAVALELQRRDVGGVSLQLMCVPVGLPVVLEKPHVRVPGDCKPPFVGRDAEHVYWLPMCLAA